MKPLLNKPSLHIVMRLKMLIWTRITQMSAHHSAQKILKRMIAWRFLSVTSEKASVLENAELRYVVYFSIIIIYGKIPRSHYGWPLKRKQKRCWK